MAGTDTEMKAALKGGEVATMKRRVSARPRSQEQNSISVEDVEAATASLRVYQPSFRELVKDTILIKVSVSCERGRTPINIAMLGLEEAPADVRQFMQEYARLGTLRLLDPVIYGQIVSTEVRMGQILQEYGIKTPWGGCAVPKKVYLECTKRLDELKARMEGLYEQLLAQYDEWVERLVNAYRTWAYVKVGIEYGATPEMMDKVGLENSMSPTAVRLAQGRVDAFVEYIRGRVPKRETIRRKFRCEWTASKIANPRALLDGEDLERLEMEKQDIETYIQTIDLEANRAEARLRLRAVEQELATEREIHRQSREQIERLYTAEIGEVLTEAAAQIRDEIYTVATDVMEKVSRGGVQERNLGRLRRLVEYAQTVAIGDDDVVKLLEPIRQAIAEGASKEPATIDRVRERLADVAVVARAELYSMARRPRVEQKMDEETLAPLDLRRARQVRTSLGIMDTDTVPVLAPRRGARARG